MLRAMSDFLGAQKTCPSASTAFWKSSRQPLRNWAWQAREPQRSRDRTRFASRGRAGLPTTILYDGKTLTFLGKNANLFTQVAAPGTVDQLIDTLQEIPQTLAWSRSLDDQLV